MLDLCVVSDPFTIYVLKMCINIDTKIIFLDHKMYVLVYKLNHTFNFTTFHNNHYMKMFHRNVELGKMLSISLKGTYRDMLKEV